jgi:hypothetical protein
MLLKVHDRVTLLGILPDQGNFITLKIVRQLQEALSFSETEIFDLKLVSADRNVQWDMSADNGKEVEIGEKATDIIVTSLKKLDREGKLTNQQMGIYETFIGS